MASIRRPILVAHAAAWAVAILVDRTRYDLTRLALASGVVKEQHHTEPNKSLDMAQKLRWPNEMEDHVS